jgi:hypothetical protein
MTAAVLLPVRRRSRWRLSSGRLLRLELRRNAMIWVIPVVAAMFWFDTYRSSLAQPAVWASRLLFVQQGRALVDLAPFVAAAAAWTGSRDGRYRTGEQVAVTALPRWTAQLSALAATACWALAAYLGALAVLLGVTQMQGPSGSLPLWPIVVGAFGVLAISALGFAAGAIFPNRFTVPLVAIVVLFALMLTQYRITHSTTFGLLSPTNLMGAPGPQAGVFYPFLRDLSLSQLIFLAGLTLSAIGVLGLRASSGSRTSMALAAMITVGGLIATGYGVRLAGTAEITTRGPVIPAVHDPADDWPLSWTPVCRDSSVPICVNPVYRAYLPSLSKALDPLLREVAGLPGAPVRVDQVLFAFHGDTLYSTSSVDGDPAVVRLGLDIGSNGASCFDTAPGHSTCVPFTTLWQDPALVTRAVRPRTAVTVIRALVGDSTAAQQAISAGLLTALDVQLSEPASTAASTDPATPAAGPPLGPNPEITLTGPASGTPAFHAAQRFAALPASTRHAWLAAHLGALRAGRLGLDQLP